MTREARERTRGPEDLRARGQERQCKGANRSGAPVQKCKSGRQRYISRSQVSAVLVSGTGLLVRVRVRVLNLYLNLNT